MFRNPEILSMGKSDTQVDRRPSEVMDKPWPSFLDLLSTSPERAFEQFYLFAQRMLTVCPPSVMWQVTPSNREDHIHDIVLHCCRDDFRVLRRYQNRGKPFAAWFMLVARNKILDQLRSKANAPKVSLAEEDAENPGVVLVDSAPLADEQTERRRIVELVTGTLQNLSDQCRILIQGAAEGYRPRELTRLLGWPADQNKKASDALRECRKTLRRLLANGGLDPKRLEDLFG